MVVNYKGKDPDFDYRIAEITYDEDTESDKMDRIVDFLIDEGWDVNIVTPGYGQCVVEDMDEYKEFVKDWKVAKKQA